MTSSSTTGNVYYLAGINPVSIDSTGYSLDCDN